MEYINAVPNSRILIVNTAYTILLSYKQIAEKHLNPSDNVLIYTAENYKDATKIFETVPIDILFTSYCFYEKSDGSGLDLCKHIKQRNPNSICFMITLMDQGFCDDLRVNNKDIVDFAYDAWKSEIRQKMFSMAFAALKEKLAAKAKKEQETKPPKT